MAGVCTDVTCMGTSEAAGFTEFMEFTEEFRASCIGMA